jgi:methyltransferase (TIGR00027 family)
VALGERGRNPLMPRSTAETTCALRAIAAAEQDPALRCPDSLAAGFLGGFNVTTLAKYPLARTALRWGIERRVPGVYEYELRRVEFIDEVVLEEAAAGLDELVLLGAGLDSRPYRLADALRGVRVFEVDHPASQASKRRRLRRLLGEEPAHVSFVAVDFANDDLDASLAAAGHKGAARTLFVWSGVSFYLPEEAVAEVLSWVGGHRDPRTSIAFDAIWAGAIDGSGAYENAAKARKAIGETGEPLRWGIPEGRLEETLAAHGLRIERKLDGVAVLVHARVA